MRTNLIAYFHKFLGLYYNDYPEHLIDELFDAFSTISEIIYKDIQAKYNYLDVDSIERNFVDLIQKDTTIEAILYYRVERALFLTNPDHEFLPFLANLMRIKTCMDLYYSTEIGPGLNIQHGFGIVIGPRHKIGSNFTIHQGVTLGQKKLHSPNESIEIGDHVTLFAGARILGNIVIGDHVQVGANSVLIENAEAKSVYAGIPAKKVRTLNIS